MLTVHADSSAWPQRNEPDRQQLPALHRQCIPHTSIRYGLVRSSAVVRAVPCEASMARAAPSTVGTLLGHHSGWPFLITTGYRYCVLCTSAGSQTASRTDAAIVQRCMTTPSNFDCSTDHHRHAMPLDARQDRTASDDNPHSYQDTSSPYFPCLPLSTKPLAHSPAAPRTFSHPSLNSGLLATLVPQANLFTRTAVADSGTHPHSKSLMPHTFPRPPSVQRLPHRQLLHSSTSSPAIAQGSLGRPFLCTQRFSALLPRRACAVHCTRLYRRPAPLGTSCAPHRRTTERDTSHRAKSQEREVHSGEIK